MATTGSGGKRAMEPSTSPVGHLLPTPPQLARDFEAGVLSRQQFQAAMSLHASDLLDEVAEARKNPVAAYFEMILCRRAARRLASRHSEAELRRALAALSHIPGYPYASLVWNACHWDVPLACFLRIRKEPVFRILSFGRENGYRKLVIEHGDARRGRGTRATFLLEAVGQGNFQVVAQSP